MTKEGCENNSASLMLLIFYLKNLQKSNLIIKGINNFEHDFILKEHIIFMYIGQMEGYI